MKSTEIIKPSAMTAPLAYEGTKNNIPAAATGTNAASVEEGFPALTSVPKTDGGLPPQRADFNGMFYLSTDQRTYLQNGGLITFDEAVSDAIGGYPQGAVLDYIVGSDFTKVRSLIEDNTYNFLETPSYIDDEKWEFLDFGGSGVGAGAPIGSIFPTFCSGTYIPENCLPCNGSEYSSEQFGLFYTNYLVAGKLLTCTYEEYAASVSTYGKCGKFAVDATVGSFKTPYLPDGSFIQQAMTDTELGKAYDAGLPSITLTEAGAHTHTRGTMNIAGESTFCSWPYNIANSATGAFSATSFNVSGKQGFHSAGFDVYGNSKLIMNAANSWTGETSLNGAHTHTLSGAGLGNSTTVQPESVALRWFVVVGTGAINEADMDWSEWATSLNGRANTDLSNLSTTGQAVLSNKADINALNFSASGKDYLSKIGMPSNRGTQLTIGAAGATYIAPANGYFRALGTFNAAKPTQVTLENHTSQICASSFNNAGWSLYAWLPARKGDAVVYYYNFVDINPILHSLYFVYAEGAE